MATLTSKLILSLIDEVTAPARAISATLDRLNAIQRRNNARLDAMRGSMVETGAVAYALARAITSPTRAAAEFETKLEDIAQKVGAPISELPKLGAEMREIARATTQSAMEIAEGMDVLAGKGASRQDSLDLLGPIGRAATAYNAAIAELSEAAYSALDNLKVPAGEIGKVLDVMALSGKAGAFELKDMAQYFPALGAGYQALGQEGVAAVADLAASLQIVRKATGDSATAANNLGNLLQKIRAPQTVAAFEKMGVDLEKELAAAAKRGIAPIEAIAEITNTALKGDLSRLGYLFSDAQVQGALRPLIQNIEEYRKIRAEAMAAQGVVEEDYQRRLQTGAAAARRWAIALENLNVAIGAALLPALAELGDTIVPIINRMSAFAEAHPQLTRAVVGTAAALVGLRVAALAAQFSLLWMKGGLLNVGIAALTATRALAGMALAPVGAALMVLRNPLRLVTGAFYALRLAIIGTGIGAVLAGIALAGAWIYNNWSGIAIAFEAFKGAFMRAIKPVMPLLEPVIDGVSGLFDWVSKLVGPVDAMGAGWTKAGMAAGKFAGEALVSLTKLPEKLVAIDWNGVGESVASSLSAAWDAVSSIDWGAIGKTIISGISTGLSGTSAVMTGLGTSIVSAFETIDWSAIGKAVLVGIGGALSGVSALVISLGAAFSSAMRSIDWAGVGAAASSGYKKIADMLMSSFKAINWGSVGEFIGGAIRTAIIGIVDLGKALYEAWAGGGENGKGLGRTIGAAVAAAITGFDWAGVGGKVLTAIGEGVKALGQMMKGIIKGLFNVDLSTEGSELIDRFWTAIKTKFDELVKWFREMPNRISEAVGNIDISNLIDWPTPPTWLSGWWGDSGKGVDKSVSGAPAGGRAEPVSRIAAEAGAANDNAQAAIDTMLKSMDRLAGNVEKGGSAAVSAADAIGAAINDNISITAIPRVDTSGIDAARTKVDALAHSLQSIPSTVVTATAPALAGARASGGPVKAGGAYLVGEEGPELVTFGQNGIVHDAMKTARIIRNAAFASASMALPAAAAMPVLPGIPSFEIALPEITLPRVPQLSARPPAQEAGKAAARPVQVTLSNGAIKIEVNAAPGQSPEGIAQEVKRVLSAELNSMSSGSFSDGAN